MTSYRNRAAIGNAVILGSCALACVGLAVSAAFGRSQWYTNNVPIPAWSVTVLASLLAFLFLAEMFHQALTLRVSGSELVVRHLLFNRRIRTETIEDVLILQGWRPMAVEVRHSGRRTRIYPATQALYDFVVAQVPRCQPGGAA